MSLKCEYCKKDFSTKSNLNLHKKTAKYCLNLQSLKQDEIEEKNIFKCDYCNKKFNLKPNYLTHYHNCKEKNGELKKIKEDFNKLKEEFDNYKLEKEIDFIKTKEKLKKSKEDFNKLKEELNNYKLEKEKLLIENKYLNSLLNDEKNNLKDEKNRVDKLIDKTTNKTTKTTNIQNNKIVQLNKDNIEELFEKLPKFTQENIINSLKNKLNEDNILAGINTFVKVINTNLGEYGIVTDFSRNKVIIKDKEGKKVKTITTKMFKDGINNIEPILTNLMESSRKKVDTYNILEQDVYINNMFPIKELKIACENNRLSDKELNKHSRELTKNCIFPEEMINNMLTDPDFSDSEVRESEIDTINIEFDKNLEEEVKEMIN